jgi:hypothetical protein
MAAPAQRETPFATASAFRSVPIPHCQRRWKRWRARLPGPDGNAETQGSALRVAEAQIDLGRVRYARHKLLSDALANPHYDNIREKMAVLKNAPPDLPMEGLAAFLNSMPEGPHKFATILSQEAKQLLAMDRYERRALSRRKFAIRAFDAARKQAANAPE